MSANKAVAYDPERDAYTLTWQLDPASRQPQNSNFNNMDGAPACDASDTSHQGVQNCWKRHLRSLHTHPGTGRLDNLDSGMWDPNSWKEQGKPWWRYMLFAGADTDNPASTQLQDAGHYINKFLWGNGVKAAATGELWLGLSYSVSCASLFWCVCWPLPPPPRDGGDVLCFRTSTIPVRVPTPLQAL